MNSPGLELSPVQYTNTKLASRPHDILKKYRKEVVEIEKIDIELIEICEKQAFFHQHLERR